MSLASQFTVAAAPASGQVPLGRLPAYHARTAGDRPMLTCGGRTIGFGEFDSETNRLARVLASVGVEAGDFVAVMMPNGIATYQLAFALWKLGASPVPLSHKLPEVEARAILDLLQPRLVIEQSLAALPGLTMSDVGIPVPNEYADDPLPDVELRYWKASTRKGRCA